MNFILEWVELDLLPQLALISTVNYIKKSEGAWWNVVYRSLFEMPMKFLSSAGISTSTHWGAIFQWVQIQSKSCESFNKDLSLIGRMSKSCRVNPLLNSRLAGSSLLPQMFRGYEIMVLKLLVTQIYFRTDGSLWQFDESYSFLKRYNERYMDVIVV